MKAAVLKAPKQLVVEDIPVFPLDSNLVLVKVEACGICGSDIRYFNGENPWALHTLGEARPNPPNIVLGHEYCGTVVEVADKSFENLLGKRVGVLAYRPCGRCYWCHTGRENLCPNTTHIGHGAGWGERDYYPGGMAEYGISWADLSYPIPDSISSEEAALLDVVGVGVRAVNIGNIVPGEPIAILGCGPVGAAILQIAKAYGAGAIYVTDIYPFALSLAKDTGATMAINPHDEDIVKLIMLETNKKGCCTVFDTIGTVTSLEQGLKITGKQGTLVELAVHDVSIPLNIMALSSERSIKTSCNSRLQDYQTCINLLEARRIIIQPWISHRFTLTDVPKAFKIMELKEQNNAFKIMILPNN